MKLSEQLEQFVKLNGEAGYGTVPTWLAEMWLSEVKDLESRTVGGMIAEGLEELVEDVKEGRLDLAKPLEGKSEPKILKTQEGKGMYGVVTVPENHFVGFGEGIQRAADLAAHIHEPTRIVQLLEPEEDSDAISTALGTVPHDWGIMFISEHGHLMWRTTKFSLTSSLTGSVIRFITYGAAKSHIDFYGLTSCQPWPIPKLEEQ